MRQSDHELAGNARTAGPLSTENVLLSVMEVVADLRREGRGPRAAGSGAETLDDILFGLEASGEFGGADGMDGLLRGQGARGAGNLLRLSRAIEREPERWSEWFDLAVARRLGCDVTGMPWSLQEYGRQQIRVGQLDTHEYMWTMICTLHSLHRSNQVALLGAKLGQYAKAIEASVRAKGRWEYAWLFTGEEDPRAKGAGRRGLTHPAEFAAAVAYTKEVRALEEYLGRESGRGSQGGGKSEEEEPWWKKKKKKGGKKGGGRGDSGPPEGGQEGR